MKYSNSNNKLLRTGVSNTLAKSDSIDKYLPTEKWPWLWWSKSLDGSALPDSTLRFVCWHKNMSHTHPFQSFSLGSTISQGISRLRNCLFTLLASRLLPFCRFQFCSLPNGTQSAEIWKMRRRKRNYKPWPGVSFHPAILVSCSTSRLQ